jgi:F-type H+-transporting ATPase subunit b
MRRCLLIGLVLTALALAFPAPLLAATAEHEGEKAKDHGAQKKKKHGVEEGLFKGALELSIWTIVVFLVLLAILRRYAWGPILAGLKQREDGIARDRAEADLARKEAARAREELDKRMKEVNAEISRMLAKAHQDAQATVAEDVARNKAELQAERDRAYRDLAVARDQALEEIHGHTANLATLIAGKAIGKQVNADDHRTLVAEALDEFRAGKARPGDTEGLRG